MDVRGQIAFRDAVGSGADTYPDRSGTRVPFRFYVAIGMVEVPAGHEIRDEEVLGFEASESRGGLTLRIAGRGNPLPDWNGDCDLPGVLGSLEVPAPFLGALLCTGAIVARRTRFPADEGRTVFALAGLLRSPRAFLPTEAIIEFSGPLYRLSCGDPVPDARLFPRGGALSQTFKHPAWGFAEPKRGFTSTLTLDLIDAVAELRSLETAVDRGPDEEARLAELMRGPARSFSISFNRDAEYARFLAQAARQGVMQRWDTYPTAEEAGATERAASAIVREILKAGADDDFEATEAPSPGF